MERCNTHPVVATAGADVVLEQSRLPPENCIAIVQATAGLAIDTRRVVDCRVVSKGDIGGPGPDGPDRVRIVAGIADDAVLDKNIVVLAVEVCARAGSVSKEEHRTQA